MATWAVPAGRLTQLCFIPLVRGLSACWKLQITSKARRLPRGGPDRHQTGGTCGIWEQSVPSSGAGACAAAAKLSKSVAEAAEFFCSNFNRVSHTGSLASWVLESRVQTVQNAHGTVSPAATGCMLVSRVPAF